MSQQTHGPTASPLSAAPLLTLRRDGNRYAICRLEPGAPLPGWAHGASPDNDSGGQHAHGARRAAFTSITRSADELSIVTAEADVPPEIRAERGFVLLSVVGPIEFGVVGLLARLAAALAGAGVPLLAIATFDTDHLLIRATHAERAVTALRSAGCRVDEAS